MYAAWWSSASAAAAEKKTPVMMTISSSALRCLLLDSWGLLLDPAIYFVGAAS